MFEANDPRFARARKGSDQLGRGRTAGDLALVVALLIVAAGTALLTAGGPVWALIAGAG